MAGDWIKMRSNLWDDPRVGSLVDATESSEAAVVGALYWLWATADQHSSDGVLQGMTLRTIDRKTGVAGIGAALVAIDWIEDNAGSVTVKRFDEHNGASAKARAQTAKRVSNHKGNAKVTHTALPEQQETVSGALPREREEKEKEKKEPEATAHAIDGSTVPDFDPPKAAPLPTRELPPVSDDPAVQLAVALRRQGITANSAHPAVQGWAAKGVTVDLLAEAVAIARGSKPDGAIPVNYLAPIVNDLLNPPAARPALPRGTPPRPTNGKFHFGDIDRSGDVAAMAANMQRRGITVPEGDEVIEL